MDRAPAGPLGRSPPPEYLGQSYSRDANRGKRLARAGWANAFRAKRKKG
jgi:hypothetical protein